MALKTYIGARYAPKFMGKWNNTTAYEPLSVVYWNNNSYVSKSNVPAGTPVTVEEPDGEVVTNSAYWILSSDWNAQVAEYQATVEQYRDEAVKQTAATNQYRKDTQNFFEVTMHSYNTEEEMKIDSTVKVGYTLVTCGKRTIGDGGGKYFKVVEETSSDAIAIAGGLWAKPFNITSPEEDWTLLPTSLDDTTITIDGDIVSGGRYIANTVILPIDKTVAIDTTAFKRKNNLQVIFIFNVTGGNFYKVVVSSVSTIEKYATTSGTWYVKATIDNGYITLSESDISGCLTTKDKKELDTKIAALENKNKSQDLQINAKVNKDAFNTYKDGYNDEHGVIYYSGYAVGAAYRIALIDRHFQIVSVDKVNFPSPKPSVASLHLELTASTGFYSGYIIIPAQSEGFNLLESKKLIVKMGRGALNSVTIDCSTQQTIGYFGTVRKINEQESYYAFTVFNATGDFAYDDDITNLRSQLTNLIDQKVSQSVYDKFVNETNGTLDTKLAQADFQAQSTYATTHSTSDTTATNARSEINAGANKNVPLFMVDYSCTDKGASNKTLQIKKTVNGLLSGTYKQQTMYVRFRNGNWTEQNLSVVFNIGSLICEMNIPEPLASDVLIFKIDVANIGGTVVGTISCNNTETTHIG